MTTPSRRLNDRYELGPTLGRGGMADVVRARDHVLHRDVAVKLLREVNAVDRERFEGEARLLAMLNHPHVVSVLDAGVDGATPWLVLELVDGATLDVLLAEGPVDAARLARIGAQVAEALTHAHDRLVVHRDVKPSNVLLAAEDRVTLTDFGIARVAGSEASLTMTGQTIGTAAYLAPEQVRGEPVDAPADVYSLGLVLLEALTGRREYEGPAVEAALARLQRSPLVPTSLPPGWSGLISTMTAMQPTDRPSAADVAARLRTLAAGPPGAGAAADLGTTTMSIPVVPAGESRRRRRTPVVVAVALLAALVLAAALRVAGGAGDAPASAGSTPSQTPRVKPVADASPTVKASATQRPAPSTRPSVRSQTRQATSTPHRAKHKQAHRKHGPGSHGPRKHRPHRR
ncbi:Serine/threonine protein kinase [metagenome]|uniref:Serine/threonine protein kinase n=1 Tax=metagenome TaxID=256318 RepID=A0A2P2C0N8_9ZZZZ